MESKKNGTNELIYKTETVKDIESKRMVMRGRGGRDNLRGWDRHIPLCAACSVTQSCPTLCDPVDCNPPGSSVHGILQARVLEWVVISFPRGGGGGGLPDSGIEPRSPALQADSLPSEPPGNI